jgi:hypothetical protein
MPEGASLPLKIDIPDITQNIYLSDNCIVTLTQGYYAISYYVSAIVKRNGFIKLTPVLKECEQAIYSAYAEAAIAGDFKIFYHRSTGRRHAVFCMELIGRRIQD